MSSYEGIDPNTPLFRGKKEEDPFAKYKENEITDFMTSLTICMAIGMIILAIGIPVMTRISTSDDTINSKAKEFHEKCQNNGDWSMHSATYGLTKNAKAETTCDKTYMYLLMVLIVIVIMVVCCLVITKVIQPKVWPDGQLPFVLCLIFICLAVVFYVINLAINGSNEEPADPVKAELVDYCKKLGSSGKDEKPDLDTVKSKFKSWYDAYKESLSTGGERCNYNYNIDSATVFSTAAICLALGTVFFGALNFDEYD